jgi:ATP-dependent Lon protease
MAGEITIMRKPRDVGGIQARLLAAMEARAKTVILLTENEQDARYLTDYLQHKIELDYVA